MYCLSIDIPGKHLTQVFLSHLPIFANNVSLNLYEPIEFGYITKTEIRFGIFQGMMKSSLLLLSQVFSNLSSATTPIVHDLSATKTCSSICNGMLPMGNMFSRIRKVLFQISRKQRYRDRESGINCFYNPPSNLKLLKVIKKRMLFEINVSTVFSYPQKVISTPQVWLNILSF